MILWAWRNVYHAAGSPAEARKDTSSLFNMTGVIHFMPRTYLINALRIALFLCAPQVIWPLLALLIKEKDWTWSSWYKLYDKPPG